MTHVLALLIGAVAVVAWFIWESHAGEREAERNRTLPR